MSLVIRRVGGLEETVIICKSPQTVELTSHSRLPLSAV